MVRLLRNRILSLTKRCQNMFEFDVTSDHSAPGDQYDNHLDAEIADHDEAVANELDSEAIREEHNKILQWWYLERGKQSENRLEQSVDADFYDNLQWDHEDAAILKARGQMPLVYNEIAPMVDWLIGTERRTRADWKVLPRSEDDVEIAGVKTEVMKFVADINHVGYARSRAFADVIKVGVGWVDDGARDDPTQDILYSKYEDWRNVLWDSASYDLDLSDARYIFRWRWVDEDVALMTFRNRRAQVLSATEDSSQYRMDNTDEDSWYGRAPTESDHGTIYAAGSGVLADAQRRRIKLIECQYRKPATVVIARSGPMSGAMFGKDDQMLAVLAEQGCDLVERVLMRVHSMVFTESDVLACGPSIYRHNRFSLTPIWCYRRSRDRLPYGVIRRVRDIQKDMNKRASKALFLLNTNQIIADEGAVDDWNTLREEASMPDGLIVKKPGKELNIRRDSEAANGQIEMMKLSAQSIQKTAGVNNENLGRATNAVSGAAIEARQSQGAVGTTEPFDNLRFAVQIQGEKQLSLIEQFYSEPKVVRLTGSKGSIDWLKINQPEIQADGSVRWLNDITESKADFIVSEQDYSGTIRQHMFESLNQMAAKLPPAMALRLMSIAMDFSDLPNKDDIVKEIRRLTGEQDPDKELTPEEAQQAQQQAQMQSEAMQMQREQAMLALDEQRAKVAKLSAEAEKIQSESGNRAAIQLQGQAADNIDILTQKLAEAQAQLADKTLEAKTKIDIAILDNDTKLRIAEIAAIASAKISALESKMETLVNEALAEKGRAKHGKVSESEPEK